MRLAAAMLALAAAGCAGDGCGMEPLPAPLPPGERVVDAVQIRLSDAALRDLGQHTTPIAHALLPGGDLTVQIHEKCSNPEVCCGVPAEQCQVQVVPSDIRVTPPAAPGGPLLVALTAHAWTPTPIYARYDGLFVNVDCWVTFDTALSGAPGITVQTEVFLDTDPDSGAVQLRFGALDLVDVEQTDVVIDGDSLCGSADSYLEDFMQDMRVDLAGEASAVVDRLLCKPCASHAECAPYGVCGERGLCEAPASAGGGRCQQELGIAGRMPGTALTRLLPPTSLFDVHLVAGGSVGTAAGGLTLGAIAGARAADASSQRCGPLAPPPQAPAIPAMSLAERNDDPELGPFDVAVGIHEAMFDRAAWALYEAGTLCTTIDTARLDKLHSDSVGIVMPSLADLMHGEVGQVEIRLRPQAPPDIRLPADGSADLEMVLPALEMDFYAMVDERFVRLFSAVVDMTVPLTLEVEDGALVPTVKSQALALANVRVVTSGVLDETPARIAGKLSAIASLTAPALVEALGPIELPTVAGLRIAVVPGGVRVIDGGAFLAVVGTLEAP